MQFIQKLYGGLPFEFILSPSPTAPGRLMGAGALSSVVVNTTILPQEPIDKGLLLCDNVFMYRGDQRDATRKRQNIRYAFQRSRKLALLPIRANTGEVVSAAFVGAGHEKVMMRTNMGHLVCSDVRSRKVIFFVDRWNTLALIHGPIDTLIDWSSHRLIDCLFSWLIDWMIDWLIEWMNEWMNDWLIDWLID